MVTTREIRSRGQEKRGDVVTPAAGGGGLALSIGTGFGDRENRQTEKDEMKRGKAGLANSGDRKERGRCPGLGGKRGFCQWNGCVRGERT